MAVSQSISLTHGTQNIEKNTSQVTFKWTSTQTGSSYNGYTRTAKYYVSINGGDETEYSVSYTLPQSSTKTIVEKTFTVTHKDDGTGTISVRTWMDTRISAGVVEKSKSLTLSTIPRASTLDALSCSSAYFDGTITYKYTPKSPNYYNRCTIYLNLNGTNTSIRSIDLGKKSASQQSGEVTLNNNNLITICDALPETTRGTLRLTLRTYQDSGYKTQVGDAVYKEITLTIPTKVKPALGTVTLTPTNITTQDEVSRNVLVQGKNKITVSIDSCTTGRGTQIKSYTYTALIGSTVIKTITTTSTSASFGPFTQSGTIKFMVAVTDTRDRFDDNSGSEPTWTCYAYEEPYFTSFNAYRADQDGNADINGSYLKCTYASKYSQVGGTNNTIVTVNYNGKTNNDTLINLGETSATYKVYLTIVDNYGGSNKSSTITVFGQSRVLNVTSDGTGVAIGKMAENVELFECRWPAKFDSSILIGGSTQNSAPTAGISVHDVRAADITPDSFGDKNANFYFDQIDSRWMSILHMKGWTGDYAAWELAGNAHNSASDDTLKYRQGLGDTWGDWQTVITNKNINSYIDKGSYLPLDGSQALTGKLILDANLYYASGNTAGIDCQNSDIINANGIYFKDASDSAGESINFYHSDGKWDTLYAHDGKLKFHPNRGTNTALGGYTVYNNSNFRRGTCTLSSSNDTTVSFSSALGGAPTVILTPLTSEVGTITGKVKSTSSTGFTAIIGGNSVSSAKFAYLAIYY